MERLKKLFREKKSDILGAAFLLVCLVGLIWIAYVADKNSGAADATIAKKLFNEVDFSAFDNCTVELKSSNSMMMTQNSDNVVDTDGNKVNSELFDGMQVLMNVELDLTSDINGNKAHTSGKQSVTQSNKIETVSLDDYIDKNVRYSYVEADKTWVKSEYDEELKVLAYVIEQENLDNITDIKVDSENDDYYKITGKILGKHLSNDESLGDLEIIKALNEKTFKVELRISKKSKNIVYEYVELLEKAEINSEDKGYTSELQAVTYEFKYDNFGNVDVAIPKEVMDKSVDYETYVSKKETVEKATEAETEQVEENETSIGVTGNIELNGMDIDLPEKCFAVKANINGLDGIAVTNEERTENIAVLLNKGEKQSGKTTFMENSVNSINKLLESDEMTTNLLGLVQETDSFYTQVMAISDAWLFTVGVKESEEVYVVIAYRTEEYSVDKHDIEHLLLSIYNELNENTDANAELVNKFISALYTEKEQVSENSVSEEQETSEQASEQETKQGLKVNLAYEICGVNSVDKEKLEQLTSYRFSDAEAKELVNILNNYSTEEFKQYLGYWNYMGTSNKKACAWVVKLKGIDSVEEAVKLGANQAELEGFLKGLNDR